MLSERRLWTKVYPVGFTLTEHGEPGEEVGESDTSCSGPGSMIDCWDWAPTIVASSDCGMNANLQTCCKNSE